MKAKRFMQDNSAVSEVLGVVLIIGILVAAFSIVISISLPHWTKSFEAAHAGEVVDEFSELASQIDSVVLVAKHGGKIAAGTTAITMKPDRVPVIGMSPPGSSLEFRRDKDRFYITPYVSGAPTPPPGEARFWEETTTDNFSHTNATRVNVDVALDTIRLSRLDVSGDLILDNTATTLSGECHYDKVELTNSSIINLVFGNYLRIYANTIYIDDTSRINADELGCFGGDSGRSGTGTGAGSFGYMGSGGGGAGHNGTGGDGGLGGNATLGNESGVGGTFYGGNASFLLDFGSGGGGGAYGEGGTGAPHQGQVGGDGGHGGGAVLLDAAQIIIYGTISANGGDGFDGSEASLAPGGGGGGSGGTITIRGYDINLTSATLSAKGGAGGDGGDSTKDYGGGGGGGGAGGRIKIFFDNESRYAAPSFSGDECAGGAGGALGDANKYLGDPGDLGNNGAPYENQTTYIASVPHYTFGYYKSRVFDTGNTTTCYDNITWDGYTTEYTSITVKVRTSIYEEMEGGNATLWANCDAVANEQNLTDSNSVFDWHQYIQYRVELSTYDETMTPVFYGINITYNTSDPAGGFPVIADSTGMVKFKSGHIYYPKQEIAYEHGAVIKCQREKGEEEGIILQPPPILINNESGVPTIDISMIDLTGTNDSYSGTTAMSVENSFDSYDSISTKFHNLSLNISTEYPTIWGKWFNDTLAESGLNESKYEVMKTDIYVVADFYGDEQHVHLVAVDKTKVEVTLAT